MIGNGRVDVGIESFFHGVVVNKFRQQPPVVVPKWCRRQEYDGIFGKGIH